MVHNSIETRKPCSSVRLDALHDTSTFPQCHGTHIAGAGATGAVIFCPEAGARARTVLPFYSGAGAGADSDHRYSRFRIPGFDASR